MHVIYCLLTRWQLYTSKMDEVSRGLDEMALGSSENNNVLPSQEVRHTGVEACGCAEVELSRNDSVGAITT